MSYCKKCGYQTSNGEICLVCQKTPEKCDLCGGVIGPWPTYRQGKWMCLECFMGDGAGKAYETIRELKRRCETAEAAQTAAERNLACIADMLNTWARECNQREVTDYLGPCVLRDALKEQTGAANKREYELRAQLARWPEAVAELRAKYPEGLLQHPRLLLDELSRLATEKR